MAMALLPEPLSPTMAMRSPRRSVEGDAVDGLHHAGVGQEVGVQVADVQDRVGDLLRKS